MTVPAWPDVLRSDWKKLLDLRRKEWLALPDDVLALDSYVLQVGTYVLHHDRLRWLPSDEILKLDVVGSDFTGRTVEDVIRESIIDAIGGDIFEWARDQYAKAHEETTP